MYNVRLYLNSGFNSDNTPGDPTLLNSLSYIDVPAIDTLTDHFLTNIRIRASIRSIENADFCRISDDTRAFYYSIPAGGIVPVNADTVSLSLVPDFILSAGGFSRLTFLDGIIERAHVALSDDTFGSYTMDDELTQPVHPLVMVQNVIKPWGDNVSLADKYQTLIEATADLHVYDEDPDLAVTYTSQTGETVAVPYMANIPYATDHFYGGKRGTCTYRLDGLGSDGTGESPQILDGLKRARGLGMETAVISQYKVPEAFISSSSPVTSFDTTKRAYTKLAGMTREYETGIPWEQSNSVNNKRCLYGSYVPFGIITCAGNRATFKAEDIYETDEDAGSSPTLSVHPDIRSDGRPYWRFRWYKGTGENFWQNCLAGSDWQNVPLVYREASGNILNRMQFEAQETMEKHAYGWGQLLNASSAAKNAVGAFSGVDTDSMPYLTGALRRKNFGNALEISGAMGLTGAVANAGVAVAEGVARGIALRDMYKQRGITQTLSYLASNAVVAPEMQIPYNTSIMREIFGNGAIVYRYTYDAYDLARIDRLLSMYGYKHTKAIQASDFTNRRKFNYVLAHGVSVGNLPKWWADGIAYQLEGGVRVWHVLPDVTAYTDGSNV